MSTLTPLHLHKLEIANFLRVTALTVDAGGRHVVISGENGAGKTSAVDAIFAALRYASAPNIPEPINQGASRAAVRLDLGEYQVERRWTTSGSELIVRAADGARVQKPQQLLDGLLGKYSLDPVAFLSRRPQDQVDDVLSMAAVNPPVNQVAALTGETHAPRPGESADGYLLRLSADETGLYYQRRRDAGRDAGRRAQALAELQRRLAELGGPPTGPEGGGAAGVVEQIQALQAQADQRRAVQDEARARRQECARAAAKLAALDEDGKRDGVACLDLEQRIAELQEQLSARRKRYAETAVRVKRGVGIVADLDADALAAEEAAAALPDPSAEITALRRRLADTEAETRARARRAALAEQARQLAGEAERGRAEHERLEGILAALRDLRAHLLHGVDLGVAGLAVGEGGLRLGGVPLRQASMAEQLRVAAAVAMHQNPRLKLLRLDEGERLDRQSVELLLGLADERDFQVIMTRVADVEGLKVEIVEGAARA